MRILILERLIIQLLVLLICEFWVAVCLIFCLAIGRILNLLIRLSLTRKSARIFIYWNVSLWLRLIIILWRLLDVIGESSIIFLNGITVIFINLFRSWTIITLVHVDIPSIMLTFLAHHIGRISHHINLLLHFIFARLP